eukprot:jgi/Mesvir1/9715/Mv12186-RA.1
MALSRLSSLRHLAARSRQTVMSAVSTPSVFSSMLSPSVQAISDMKPLGITPGSSRGLMYVNGPGDGKPRNVTLIPGDGIGPEITGAAERVIEAMGAPIVWEKFTNVNSNANAGSVPPAVKESILRTGVCLKGVLYTAHDPSNRSTFMDKSMNMALRRELDLYVNLVAVRNFPNTATRHTGVDLVIIRENTEGEYSGLEHEVVDGVVESLKVITKHNSERIAQYAFEYAFMNNRKKVTAVHKANIMKLADGMFLDACRSVAKRYPRIKFEEMIVDNTAMQLVSNPSQFDVMVTPNLYGSLVTNIGAGLAGGPGLLPGANIGERIAVFEQGARHVGNDIAGKNVANPTALLLSTVLLLRHIRLNSFADRLEAAVVKVITDGTVRTGDMGGKATTTEFTDAVIKEVLEEA